MQEIKTIPRTDVLYRKWGEPNSKAVLLAVHGLGAHSERWDFLAQHFLKKSIATYALELKGFGETKGVQGHISSFKTYYSDILQVVNVIKKENPGEKIFIIGESMGGLISFLLGASGLQFFSGLICISPAFKSVLKFSLLDRLNIYIALLHNTKKSFNVPFDSKMCTRDTAYQKKMDSDKRELRIATAWLLLHIVFQQFHAKRLARKINLPVLFLLPGQDALVSTKESRKVFKKLKISDKQIIEYPELRHALSIELDREKVFEDIWTWLKDRI